jgi:hypothetical protein
LHGEIQHKYTIKLNNIENKLTKEDFKTVLEVISNNLFLSWNTETNEKTPAITIPVDSFRTLQGDFELNCLYEHYLNILKNN